MGKASKIMYTIGRIFNIVGIVISAIVLLLGMIFTIIGGVENAADDNTAALLASGLSMLVSGIICLAIEIVVFVLASKASKALENNTTENKPHIIMIVVGAVGSDIFYLLGGIFGLVAENS